jgi:RNA polymerase sigma-70 factor (ECF subfamily)
MIIFQQSDEDLMALAALDQNGPFDELVRRYQNRLLAVTYRSIKDPDTVEDIVQVAFIRAWDDRKRFDKNIAKFSTWIYSILQQQIDKYLRDSRNRRQMISLSSVEEDKDVLASILDDQSEEGNRGSWVDDLSESQIAKVKEIVLRYLDKEDQKLYELKEEKGFSCKSISQMAPFKGMRVATLQKRCQRYINKIIEALAMEKYENMKGTTKP